MGLSADGSQALLWYHGDGPPGVALLQSTRGGPPLRLGEGRAHGLSADGRWVRLGVARRRAFAGLRRGAAGKAPGVLEDGSILARAGDGSLAAYSPSGGAGRALGWRLHSDPFVDAVRGSDDGRFLFVREGSVPARLSRIDLRTGSRASWLDLGPRSATGVGHVWSVQLTPDGRGYAYTHGLFLQDLFVVEGLP